MPVWVRPTGTHPNIGDADSSWVKAAVAGHGVIVTSCYRSDCQIRWARRQL